MVLAARPRGWLLFLPGWLAVSGSLLSAIALSSGVRPFAQDDAGSHRDAPDWFGGLPIGAGETSGALVGLGDRSDRYVFSPPPKAVLRVQEATASGGYVVLLDPTGRVRGWTDARQASMTAVALPEGAWTVFVTRLVDSVDTSTLSYTLDLSYETHARAWTGESAPGTNVSFEMTHAPGVFARLDVVHELQSADTANDRAEVSVELQQVDLGRYCYARYDLPLAAGILSEPAAHVDDGTTEVTAPALPLLPLAGRSGVAVVGPSVVRYAATFAESQGVKVTVYAVYDGSIELGFPEGGELVMARTGDFRATSGVNAEVGPLTAAGDATFAKSFATSADTFVLADATDREFSLPPVTLDVRSPLDDWSVTNDWRTGFTWHAPPGEYAARVHNDVGAGFDRIRFAVIRTPFDGFCL